MFANLSKSERGAAMVEFAIIAPLLFLLTFGIVEFGYLFWQWNSAEKATQMGVRMAVVTDPVATGLKTFNCANANTPPGTLCSNGGSSFASSASGIVCTGSGTSWASASGSCTGCANGVSCTFAATAFTRIGNAMQAVFPLVQPQNVTVTYADAGLGFAGRPEPVPVVTVGLTGMTFTFLALQGLAGLHALTMPDFRATLTGEDMDTCSPDVTSC